LQWSGRRLLSRPTEVMRAAAGEIRLEHVDDRLRLSIDHGPERVEIGETLGAPDKEWLAGVLRQ
jgi:hypothetical protein